MFCMREKVKRSFHCHICKICIKKYDHHCYWINNCVGRHNIRSFITFLLLFNLNLIFLCTLSTLTMVASFSEEEMRSKSYINFWIPSLVIQIVCGLEALFCLVLMPFTILLLGVQLKNIYLDKSTYERFSNKKSTLEAEDSYLIKEKLSKKKRSQGKCSNFSLLCCPEEQKDSLLSS